MDESGIMRMLETLGSDTSRVKRTGGNLIAPCPLASYTHSKGVDTKPSFSITVNDGGPSKWRCWSCGEAANQTISLLYKLKDHGGGWRSDIHDMINQNARGSIVNRMKRLGSFDEGRKKNWIKRRPTSNEAWEVKGYEAKIDLADFAEDLKEIPQYALDRGITLEQAADWHIGFRRNMYPPRLMFSILDESGKMVGWSGRLLTDDGDEGYGKYHHMKYFKREKYFYGEWKLDHSKRVGYLMEGFMDVLNLDRLGLKNCLATMGVSPSSYQIEKVKKWFDHVVIFPHDDEPNEKGERVGLKMAEDYKVALSVVGVDAIVGPIVPIERDFLSVNRNPKDPGEWLKSDLDWVFEKLRGQLSERKRQAETTGKEKKEA